MADKNLVEQLSELGLDRLERLPFFKNTPSTRRAIFKFNRANLLATEKDGHFETLYRGGRLIGFYSFSHKASLGAPGVAGTAVTCLYSRGSQKAFDWLKSNIVNSSRDLTAKHVAVNVSPTRPELVDFFVNQGFGINSLLLVGDPKIAIKRLLKEYDPPGDLNHLGLSIEPMATIEDVEAAVRLKKREFSRHPEFGFFAASKAYLDEVRKDYAESLKRKKQPNLVIKNQRGTVLGHFSSTTSRNGFWGRAAGFELTFHEKIQAMGVSKTAYRVMLNEAIRTKADVFIGGTSQPAVMKIGRVMERRILGYWMLKGISYFPPEHFAAFYPRSIK